MTSFVFKEYVPNSGSKNKCKAAKPSSKPCKPQVESRPVPTGDSLYAVGFDETSHYTQPDDQVCFHNEPFGDDYGLLDDNRSSGLEDCLPVGLPSAGQGDFPRECGKGAPIQGLQRTFANVQDGANYDVVQDRAESPSSVAAGDAVGGSLTVINGPASGQPGGDERISSRPAGTPGTAELGTEALTSARNGQRDGQRPASPAGALALAHELSSAIPGSVTQRQGLNMVGVPLPAVEQQNRDSAHIAGHDSYHGPSPSHDAAGNDHTGFGSLHRKRTRSPDESNGDERRRSTKRQAFEDTSSTERAPRRRGEHELDSPRRKTVPTIASETRLPSGFGGRDQFILIKTLKEMRELIDRCLFITEADAPSSEAGPTLSIVTKTGSVSAPGSVSQGMDGVEQSDTEDDCSVASDASEREAERYKRTDSRTTAQQTGQRRPWLVLDEKRLQVHMDDPEVEKMAVKARKTKEAWIAAHLNRSESAVKQH